MELKVGYYVTRNSYHNDLVFKIVKIEFIIWHKIVKIDKKLNKIKKFSKKILTINGK